jgi:hypothetical protein
MYLISFNLSVTFPTSFMVHVQVMSDDRSCQPTKLIIDLEMSGNRAVTVSNTASHDYVTVTLLC